MTRPYCTACESNVRGSFAVHLSTARHRRSTRAVFSGRYSMRARPNWARGLGAGRTGWDMLPDEAYR